MNPIQAGKKGIFKYSLLTFNHAIQLETYRPRIVDDPEACSRRRLFHLEPCRETDRNKPQIVRSKFSLWTWRWPTNCLHLSTALLFFPDILKHIWNQLVWKSYIRSVHLFINNLVSYLQVSTPTFFILTVMAEEVPSCSVPKSTLDGRSWNPLAITFGSVKEMVLHFLRTGSSTDRN